MVEITKTGDRLRLRSAINQHPCFNHDSKKGRIHLPVCPACNIYCNFCIRKIDTANDEIRPGVSSELIRPEDSSDYIRKALELCPEISVVGVAGPGDTLATNHAIRAFEVVGRDFPDLVKCMSTNGLLLPKRIEDLVRVGINTLTVTVNAVAPEIQAQICDGIIYEGRLIRGEEAAEIQIQNQLEGIALAKEAGITVKVNSVLVPEINAHHIAEIAAAVSKAGADIYNIIPLIPQHRFANLEAPTCEAIDAARQAAEQFSPVFRHCQHCRADAVGMIGGADFRKEIYGKSAPETFSHG